MNVLLTALLVVVLASPSQAIAKEPSMTIVTDTWPPYVISENNQLSGRDVDITYAVFKRLNIPVSIEVLPWKRCIELVKQQRADAILGISLTDERTEFLYYPNSPISKGTTVFFKKKEAQFASSQLADLNQKRAGAMLGYSYCEELDNSPLILKAERVSKLEQNFHKLLMGRLDLVVSVDSVGFYTAQQMGISEQVSVLPDARFCIGGNYLAFAKKAGYDNFAARFNTALESFKLTEEYRLILQNYGVTQD